MYKFYRLGRAGIPPLPYQSLLRLSGRDNFNNAFLNGDLMEEVYMNAPPGFSFGRSTDGRPMVCKLRKAIYGLKQTPRAWFQKLQQALNSLGLVASRSDPCLFIKKIKSDVVYLILYVDDIIITGSNQDVIQKLIADMGDLFSLKDLGPLSYFLGIEFYPTEPGILLSQRKYILSLLQDVKFLNAKPCPTPMTTNIQLSSTDGNCYSNSKLYRSVLGKLQYLCYTRPEISFAVNRLSRFLQDPRDPHWVDVKRILRYLAGTIDYGLHIRSLPWLYVQGFADSDWASNKEDHRSVSGHCTYIGTNPVMWVSKCQLVVSRSATEAKYRSLADASSDVLWVVKLLQEMHISLLAPPIVWCDNSGAIALASNPVLHSKTKHVEIDLHFLREKVAAGQLQIGYVPSHDQVADVLTKPLGRTMFIPFRDRLNICSQSQTTKQVV